VLSQLHSLPEEFVVRHVLHGFNFLLPSGVELELNSLDGKQKSEELVVSLDGVLVQEQMKRPLDIVVERQPTPGVLLVGLERAGERPVLEEQSVGEVICLVSESEESRPVVHCDEVCEFQLHLDDWVFHDNVLVSSHIVEVDVHERHLQLFVLLVVVDDDLVKIVVHEVDV
jgi:hypothetical protein